MTRLWGPGAPFVRGVNLPWLSYGNDFGASAWHPQGGVCRTGPRDVLAATFARLADAGIPVVRWFVLCDGRAGLCEAEDGRLEGLDEHAFHDFRTAVECAETHGLALIPVLLDFHWCAPAREIGGVRCWAKADGAASTAAPSTRLDTKDVAFMKTPGNSGV